MKFFLVHGWGLDAGFWSPLHKAMPERFQKFERVDLGFLNGREERKEPEKDMVAMGHSLGFLWLLSNMPEYPWAGMISLNGFFRFSKRRDFPEGVSPRILRQMGRRLRSDHQGTLRDFYRLCGADETELFPEYSGERPNVGQLLRGLQWLEQWEACSSLHRQIHQNRTPVLALAARDDRVVSSAMTSALFEHENVAMRWSEEGGHLLPWMRPAWCSDQIVQFLDRQKR